MPNRRELLDSLTALIKVGIKNGETALALGREITVFLSDSIRAKRPTEPELTALLEEVMSDDALKDFSARTGWDGNRSDGQQVIRITNK